MAASIRIRLRIVALTVIATLASIAFATTVRSQSSTVPQYTPGGELVTPSGFETWVFVGSNLGLAYKHETLHTTAKESAQADVQVFHNIYINPEAYAYFVATGEFPDRTVLVMDVFTAVDRDPKDVLAKGVYNGERVGLEVAVKNLNRPDGEKTPWAYYQLDPKDPRSTAKAEANEDCEECHRKINTSTDNVWVQFYPTLRQLLKK